MTRFKSLRWASGMIGAALLVSIPAAAGAASALDKTLQPLGFLVGRWETTIAVPETGGHTHGASTIVAEADGRVLVRSDRNDSFDKAGKPTQGFGQVMMVYADRGGICADYVHGDGHVVHYGPAVIVDGKSVEWTSAPAPGEPAYRLRYEADGANGLKIWFGLKPPGRAAFSPIAVGEVYRAS